MSKKNKKKSIMLQIFRDDDEFKTPLWSRTDVFEYYKSGTYLSNNYEDCVHCPARYWVDEALHWCVVQNKAKNHILPPTCTIYNWTKFILEYI